MGFALSAHSSIMALQIECFSSSLSDRLLVGHPSRPIHLNLPRFPPSRRSVLALARRRNPTSSSSSSKKNKKSLRHKEPAKEDDIDEDAFEALFSQLEEDLKNEDPSLDDGDDEISEEDLAMLVQELAEALGDDDIPMSDSSADDTESGNIAEEDEDKEEEEEEERPVKLRNWQLRRLASALKAGRRKTSIKNLAAELCLDRAVVLELLRDPPPNLLMMSAALPDEPAPTVSLSVPEPKPMETTHSEPSVHTEESGTKLQAPVHVMQHKWSAQKRLKKVQVETLERVYGRTKRPTNAMISSVVHVTNLPRKRVVKWFEDKRAEDGVPDQHPPYQRSVPETV